MALYGADAVTIDRNARDFKLPDQFEWKESSGSVSKTATLFGDPSKSGARRRRPRYPTSDALRRNGARGRYPRVHRHRSSGEELGEIGRKLSCSVSKRYGSRLRRSQSRWWCRTVSKVLAVSQAPGAPSQVKVSRECRSSRGVE